MLEDELLEIESNLAGGLNFVYYDDNGSVEFSVMTKDALEEIIETIQDHIDSEMQ